MEYQLLSKVYYKDMEEYENLYSQRYHNEATIHLPVKVKGNQAFIVNEPRISFQIEQIGKRNAKLIRLINDAPGIAQYAYQKKSLIDEIMKSNEIEGVHSTRREIRLAIDGEKKDLRFYGQVQKYIKIYEEDIQLIDSSDIRTLYDEMYSPEIRNEDALDGLVFRKQSVSVVDGIKILHQGVMPEENIIDTIDKVLFWMNNEKISNLIKVSAFHYIFGYVHPFYDGNGRLARFLSSYYLTDTLNVVGVLQLSSVINENKIGYYRGFDICNDEKNRGDITPFVLMFLNLILQSIDRAIENLEESIQQLDFHRKLISELDCDRKLKDSLFLIVQNSLFDDEKVTYQWLSEHMEISRSTASKYINLLIDDGFVEILEEGRPILFQANFKKLEEMKTHS